MGDEVAEVVRSTKVAALACHHVQAACCEGWKLLERLQDEGQIRVNAAGARLADAGQSSLLQDALDGAVVDLQLAGDGAHTPTFDMVVAQDLGMKLRGHGHGQTLYAQINEGLGGCGGAGNQSVQTDRSNRDRNDTAQAPAVRYQRVPPPRMAVKQAVPGVGNPDASPIDRVLLGAHANGVCAGHV
jgi:hypothetical protein